MLKITLTLLCLALAAQAKTRKGYMPQDLWQKFKDVPAPDEKIVGGTDILDLSERPFQVAYLYYGSLACGGSIIDKRTVLTAAHCCRGDTPDIVQVRAGSLKHESGGKVYDVSEIHIHPEYSSQNTQNDACILITTEDFDFPELQFASLPERALSHDKGQDMVVTGWGTTSSGGDISPTMKTVTVPYVTDQECKEAYGSSFDGTSMICAGEAGKDSCQGDSGGPMTWYDFTAQIDYHVGIVSWGRGCALAGYPGVYGQTDNFLDFITEHMR